MAEQAEKVQGALYASLARTSRQVREERGIDLVEELKIAYERRAQDIQMDINKLKNQQKRALDFSGTSTTSLVVKDIDAIDILDTDLGYELKIHNLNIKLEHVQKRLNHLFVETNTED